MRFVPRLARDGINVSDTHPLAEAGILIVGLTAIFVVIALALYTADLEPGGSNWLGDPAAEFGLGLDFGNGNLAFRLAGTYLDGTMDESGALITAGFNYRF